MHSDDYDETLRLPLSWWLLGLLFVVAVGWAFLVATSAAATIAASIVAAAIVAGVLGRYGSARIGTGPAGLTAGRAVLPWASIGRAEALDRDQTRRALGVEANATAYLLVRSYCRGSVRVWLDDPLDPTPYWLISTRRADELARHLSARAVEH